VRDLARPDSGIWEVRSEPLHFTHSKMTCWVALDRAVRLAERGEIPHAHAARWHAQAEAISAFIDERCFSEELGSYVRSAGSRELDASLLLGALMDYPARRDPRMTATIAAIRRELGQGPLLDRYSGEDGLAGGEGAFLCCSFWLVDALARAQRTDEATALMDQLIGLANDVGLYAEEVDQDTGDFLGNLPQGLVHLALINAAVAVSKAPPHEHLGRGRRWLRRNAGPDHHAQARRRARAHADGPAFLLGTMITAQRTRAKALGYAMHFIAGQLFALAYFAIFSAIGHSGWWLGAAFGLAHGLFASTALVNVLLPVIHPRMGTPSSAAADRPLLEPPEFMLLNYGARTPLATIIAHVAYGTIVGGFTTLAN
jgi:hypothetical protein